MICDLRAVDSHQPKRALIWPNLTKRWDFWLSVCLFVCLRRKYGISAVAHCASEHTPRLSCWELCKNLGYMPTSFEWWPIAAEPDSAIHHCLSGRYREQRATADPSTGYRGTLLLTLSTSRRWPSPCSARRSSWSWRSTSGRLEWEKTEISLLNQWSSPVLNCTSCIDVGFKLCWYWIEI